MRALSIVVLFSLTALVALAAGCGEPRADTPPVAAPSAVRFPFELYGHPGPWWRNNATQAEFDSDVWDCRTESKRARRAAPSQERKDAAYRTFLDCMGGHGWTRGYPISTRTG